MVGKTKMIAVEELLRKFSFKRKMDLAAFLDEIDVPVLVLNGRSWVNEKVFEEAIEGITQKGGKGIDDGSTRLGSFGLPPKERVLARGRKLDDIEVFNGFTLSGDKDCGPKVDYDKPLEND